MVKELKTSKIRGLIAEHGITQKELAEIIGISEQSMNLKLKGKRQFKANEIGKIARYFDIEVDFLFN